MHKHTNIIEVYSDILLGFMNISLDDNMHELSECYVLVIMDRIPISGSICVSREMKSAWTELSSVRKLLRIATELWWIWLFNNVNKRYLHTALPLFALYFLDVLVITHRPNAGKTLFTCYYILAETKGEHAGFVFGSLHLAVSEVPTSSKGRNFLWVVTRTNSPTIIVLGK